MGRKKAIKEPKPKKEPEITPDETDRTGDVEIHEEEEIFPAIDKTWQENEESTLPVKDLFRIDEVADYFSVSERTIRLWIDHGHLKSEKVVGSIRISRKSILDCRFRKKGTADIQ